MYIYFNVSQLVYIEALIVKKCNYNYVISITIIIITSIPRANISVYIPSEGLMPGQSFQDEIADKIKRGCRKTVIIMSPDYIDSSWCNYEARLAHHKNPGEIFIFNIKLK